MVNRALIRTLENDPEIDKIWEQEVANFEEAGLFQDQGSISADFEVNKIVEGRILRVEDGNVMVDIGFKSEASVPVDEWKEGEEPPQVGQLVKVLIQDLEDEQAQPEDGGMLRVSKLQADRQIQWNEVISKLKEGDPVTGVVERKIKGGLLVDIGGVKVFLPASQVDIRRPSDIGDYIGRTVQCEVLKIDEARRNIVVSRRSLIERQREEDREALLKELEVGQTRKGVVKNIADFGAFVDLGGIDGLLHITDMSWERIGHPSEMVSIDQEIEVMVLHIDREKKKIALGLKQKGNNPWDQVIEKYPGRQHAHG
jgi:small subunit ribosomal protein S1